VLRQVRPASVPLLSRLRPRRAASHGGTIRLVATRKFRPETQTGVRERCLYIAPAKLTRYPKDRNLKSFSDAAIVFAVGGDWQEYKYLECSKQPYFKCTLNVR